MVEKIPYRPAKEWLGILGRWPYPAVLAGQWSSQHDRPLSYVTADPLRVSSSRGGDTWVFEGRRERRMVGSPFEVFEKMWAHVDHAPDNTWSRGLTVGYWAYELGNWFERLPAPRSDPWDLPDAWWGWYDAYIALDDEAQESWIVGTRDKVIRWKQAAARPMESPPGRHAVGEWTAGMDRASHHRAVRKIQEEIVKGNVYQVNLAYRMEASFEGSVRSLVSNVLDGDRMPYTAYVDAGEFQVVSLSPELFVKRSYDAIETIPMKGTRPRGASQGEDERLRKELDASEKDRAEHVMIVDLERNDVGRLARSGTVRVDGLFEVKGFPTVWQMISRVRGEVPHEMKWIDVCRALFPGGSVTGAPKIRAMELIRELEPVPRRVYTGALGYCAWDGSGVLNMPIRTMVVKDQRVQFHVGGGITIDSDPEEEFQETIVKSRSMLNALGADALTGVT